MSWNHRLVYFPSQGATAVMEVFYNENGEPWNCSKAHASHSEHWKDGQKAEDSIREQLEDMIEATKKPILNIDTDFNNEVPASVRDGIGNLK